MKAAIRVDANDRVGNGHLSRCLILADELREHGVQVVFISADTFNGFYDSVSDKNFPIFSIPSENWQKDADMTSAYLKVQGHVDWLVVDHYFLDLKWETKLRPFVEKIMVIDDLANRSHHCDLLIDYAYGENGFRYQGLFPDNCIGLFGSKYVLLKKEFIQERNRILSSGQPESESVVHVFFGGVDEKNHTVKYSRLLLSHFFDIKLKIFVGKAYRFRTKLETLAKEFHERMSWSQNVSNMAKTMLNCNIAFGAPGITTWERAYMGLASIYVATFQNQVSILERLKRNGFCEYLGEAEKLANHEFIRGFAAFLNDSDKRNRMRRLGLDSIDGRGAERVVSQMLKPEKVYRS